MPKGTPEKGLSSRSEASHPRRFSNAVAGAALSPAVGAHSGIRLVVGVPSGTVRLAVIPSSLTGAPVSDVVLVGTGVQVLGTDAAGNVTVMQDVHPVRYGADEQFVRQAVRLDLLTGDLDGAVASAKRPGGPHPALAGLVHLVPESGSKIHSSLPAGGMTYLHLTAGGSNRA